MKAFLFSVPLLTIFMALTLGSCGPALDHHFEWPLSDKMAADQREAAADLAFVEAQERRIRTTCGNANGAIVEGDVVCIPRRGPGSKVVAYE